MFIDSIPIVPYNALRRRYGPVYVWLIEYNSKRETTHWFICEIQTRCLQLWLFQNSILCASTVPDKYFNTFYVLCLLLFIGHWHGVFKLYEQLPNIWAVLYTCLCIWFFPPLVIIPFIFIISCIYNATYTTYSSYICIGCASHLKFRFIFS